MFRLVRVMFTSRGDYPTSLDSFEPLRNVTKQNGDRTCAVADVKVSGVTDESRLVRDLTQCRGVLSFRPTSFLLTIPMISRNAAYL